VLPDSRIEIGPPLAVVHLIDEVMDFLHHVLERSLQLAFGGHFLIQRFHDREQIAVERDRGAAEGLDSAHR